jgi:hypothetical protein
MIEYRPTKSHDLIVDSRVGKANAMKGGQPIGSKAALLLVALEADPKNFGHTRQVAGNLCAFQAVNVGHFRMHHLELIAHHAGREHAKQESFNEQAQDKQQVSRLIQTSDSRRVCLLLL